MPLRLRRVVACLALLPAAAAAQPQWSVAARPLLDVSGELDADGTVLQRPVAGTRTPDGRTLIADAMGGHVLVLDRAGRLAARVGREGGGPGEFRRIEWMGRCAGDKIVVWDHRAARLTFVDPAGTLLRQTPAPFDPDVASRTIATACSASGTWALLALPRRPQPVEGQVVRGMSVLTLVGADGAARAFPVEIASGELVVAGGGGMPRPLGRTTSIALDAQRVLVGTADSAHVAVHSLDGRQTGGIRVASAERPIGKAEYEAAVEEILHLVPPAVQPRVRQLLHAQPVPRRAAPYYGLHLDPAGALWVRTSAPSERVTRFVVHDRAGRAIGRVELPRSVTVWEVGEAHVLGYFVDGGGEPHAVAYAVTRR